MRFVDFLKATVFLCAGSATMLATVTIVGLSRDFQPVLTVICVSWWLISTLAGAWLGRSRQTTAPIARLLSGAQTKSALPELRPGVTLINRLWGLILVTVAAGVLGVFEPHVAATVAGFAIIWALSWRRQEYAVAAIEERDGVRFYVVRSAPLQPMRLIRTPGFSGSFLDS